jgi:hypothetical protein
MLFSSKLIGEEGARLCGISEKPLKNCRYLHNVTKNARYKQFNDTETPAGFDQSETPQGASRGGSPVTRGKRSVIKLRLHELSHFFSGHKSKSRETLQAHFVPRRPQTAAAREHLERKVTAPLNRAFN